VKSAYREFETRVGETKSPRGSKSERLLAAIDQLPDTFRFADLQRACPGVSVDLVRKVLNDLKSGRDLECSGRGPQATWTKTKGRI